MCRKSSGQQAGQKEKRRHIATALPIRGSDQLFGEFWVRAGRLFVPGTTEIEFCSWKLSTVSGLRSICWPLVAAETPVPAPAPAAAPMAAPLPPPKTPPRIAPSAAPPPTFAAVALPRELPALDQWSVAIE